jgi:hypothetical protein
LKDAVWVVLDALAILVFVVFAVSMHDHSQRLDRIERHMGITREAK